VIDDETTDLRRAGPASGRGEAPQRDCRGSRRSFGYPVCHCPGKISEPPGTGRLGVTPDVRSWPEQSDSARVVHHPRAQHFAT
jgi:hypothetical protein